MRLPVRSLLRAALLVHAGLGESDLTPHGFCLAWTPWLLWLHVAPDATIALADHSITVALGYFVWHRRDLAFGWVFRLFALLILPCGTTHLLEI